MGSKNLAEAFMFELGNVVIDVDTLEKIWLCNFDQQVSPVNTAVRHKKKYLLGPP